MLRRCYVHISDDGGCSSYRQRLPIAYCKDELIQEGIELCGETTLDPRQYYHAYIFSRSVNDVVMQLLPEFRRRGSRIIWSTDDLLTNIPYGNIAYYAFSPEILVPYQQCLAFSDAVLVSTQRLADEMCLGGKARVVPNLIDLTVYPRGGDCPVRVVWSGGPGHNEDVEEAAEQLLQNLKKSNQPPAEGPVRIVWAGGCNHDEDLELLEKPVRALVKKYKDKISFIFFGMAPRKFMDLPQVRYIRGVPLQQFPATFSAIKPHICIAPLVDHPFNDCKSGIKFYEATATGAAFAGSDCDAYREVKNWEDGVLVKDWVEDLSRLIDDPELRDNIAYAAMQRVQAEFSWQSPTARARWLGFFRSLVT